MNENCRHQHRSFQRPTDSAGRRLENSGRNIQNVLTNSGVGCRFLPVGFVRSSFAGSIYVHNCCWTARATAIEDDAGPSEFLFTVTRNPSVEFTVDYNTLNDTATAGGETSAFARHTNLRRR